jgi:cis-3-alkyl-4-acyloxetan-2-one decarboxylase
LIHAAIVIPLWITLFSRHTPMTPQLQIEGTGEPCVVMLHGWPDTWRIWDSTVAALKTRYRCARFNLPGYTDAEHRRAFALDEVVAHIAQAVDEASPDRPVTLLLHDWGCFFGYQYAQAHPERVARVIGVDIGDAGSRHHIASLSLRAKLSTLSYQLWLALAWKLGGPVGNRMARWMASTFRAPAPPTEIFSGMGYPYAMQWFGTAGGLGRPKAFLPDVPMLFIHGERKPFSFHSQVWADRLASRPGSRVRGLPTGHWVMSQRPEAFNQTVLEWLNDTEDVTP